MYLFNFWESLNWIWNRLWLFPHFGVKQIKTKKNLWLSTNPPNPFRPSMSSGPFAAGSNRRFLVPSLSQELSSDDSSDESDSSDSAAEHSSPTHTTVSSLSTSSPSNLSSTRPTTTTTTTKEDDNESTDVLYKVETFQVSPFQHSKFFLIKMKG